MPQTAPTTLTGKAIPMFRLVALRAALKLEVLGMKRHGRRVYSIIKEEFGLKGTKQEVLEQFSKLVEEKKAEFVEAGHDRN